MRIAYAGTAIYIGARLHDRHLPPDQAVDQARVDGGRLHIGVSGQQPHYLAVRQRGTLDGGRLPQSGEEGVGIWLHRHGRTEEAATHFAEASRLHPESWTIWRQAADLRAVGEASGEAFWQRVDALGERPYYPAPDLPSAGVSAPHR